MAREDTSDFSLKAHEHFNVPVLADPRHDVKHLSAGSASDV